jgi:hypothetical protein
MTYQGDPNRNTRRRDYMRRDDGSWSPLPLALAAAVLLIGGYLLFWPTADRSAPMSRTSEQTNPTNAPGTSVNQRPTPTTPPDTTTPPATTTK